MPPGHQEHETDEPADQISKRRWFKTTARHLLTPAYADGLICRHVCLLANWFHNDSINVWVPP